MSMHLVSTPVELAELMAATHARRETIGGIDLRRVSRILDLASEDMTATVEAGITLAALQAELAKHNQWLPIDPPNAETTTIHELLAKNLSGPRRFGFFASEPLR